MTGPLVVLLGPPLAGKTTIAALLGRRTGTQVLDADHEIEARAGKPIPTIFAEDGESAFRTLEAQVVAEALRDHDGILALGGGAVVTESTRELLADYARRGGIVVLLDISAAEAARRMSGSAVSGRPLLRGRGGASGAISTWRKLKAARQPWYNELATIKVNTGRHWPGQVVNQIEKHISRFRPQVSSETPETISTEEAE